MQSRENTSNTDYLKYAINHIERRISMIDNRSSILIAAHGILFAVYAEFLRSAFIQDILDTILRKLSIAFILIAFLLLIASVFMLLKTIRPSRFPLGFWINPVRLEGVRFEFLWPGKGWTGIKEHYETAYDALDDEQIEEGLKNTNFVLLAHVSSKMTYYRYAVRLIKILVIFYFITIITLSLKAL